MNIIFFVKNTVKRTFESIKQFKDDPFYSIGQIIPVLITLVAFVGCIVAFIMFISNGGYVKQINIIKMEGFSGIKNAITKGTVPFVYQSVIHIIVNVLLAIQFINVLIVYFYESSIIRRVVTIFDMVIILVAIAIIVFFSKVNLEEIKWFDGKIDNVALTLGEWKLSTVYLIAFIVTIVAIVAFIVFLILISTGESGWMFGHGIVAAIITYAAFPLFLILLENIVPAIVSAIFVLIIWIIFKVVLYNEGGDENSSSAEVESVGEKKTYSSERQNSRITEEKVQQKNCIYIQDLNKTLGIKLYKEKRATNTFIVSDNLLAQRKLCTVKDLENGKFHIYDKATGREVKSNEIPWRKSTGGLYDS